MAAIPKPRPSVRPANKLPGHWSTAELLSGANLFDGDILIPSTTSLDADHFHFVEQSNGEVLHDIDRIGFLYWISWIQAAPADQTGPTRKLGEHTRQVVRPARFGNLQFLKRFLDRAFRIGRQCGDLGGETVDTKKKARVLRTKVTVDAALRIPKRKMKVIS